MPIDETEAQIEAAGDSAEVPECISDFLLSRLLEMNLLELRELWRTDIDALYECWGAALGTQTGQWAQQHAKDDHNG